MFLRLRQPASGRTFPPTANFIIVLAATPCRRAERERVAAPSPTECANWLPNAVVLLPMPSSSASTSSSSDSEDSDERRRRKKEERKRKREKREKKERKRRDKKDKSKHKHEKHHKHKKEKHARSIITGKRIRMEKEEDAEGEARRAALLAHFNEGEDEEVAMASSAPTSSSAAARQQLAQQAMADPALMRQLMMESADKERAKRQRLSALKGSASGGVGEEYGVGGYLTMEARQPTNYKAERAEKERQATRDG